MKSTLSEIVKQIPDWEEFMVLADQIRDLSYQKLILEKEIKEKESTVYKVATVDSTYFVSGKSPAVSYIKSAYEHTGLAGEILPLRDEYAKVSSELDRAKLQMDVYKMMVGVFQTLSANERGAGF